VNFRLLALATILMLAIPAFGLQPDQSAEQAVGESAPLPPVVGTSGDFQFPLLRTMGGMGLILFLMVGGYLAFRKFSPRCLARQRADRNLRIIETLSMGDRRSISLIEVGDSRFLIGNTPHQINLLAALPESLSLVSEPAAMSAGSKNPIRKDRGATFRNLFEVERNQAAKNPVTELPADLRAKMRQLREALERP